MEILDFCQFPSQHFRNIIDGKKKKKKNLLKIAK
jgi:hypothetical protein